MIYAVLLLIVVVCAILDPLLVGAVALRLSMLDHERLRAAGAPNLLAFTPGGGAQSMWDLLLGPVHRRVGDRFLSVSVWALRTSLVVGAAAWVGTWVVSR